VGTGTTADGVLNEARTGLPTGGKFHTMKADQYSSALRSVLKNGNLSDNDRIVAQSLLADVERWCEATLADESADGRARLQSVLAFIESGFNSGSEVAEVTSVLFLENLPRTGEPNAELRSLVGPACIAQLGVIG
jgi:hypothetical protein